jgi:O-antigen/teichoic acid export membrane protein
MGVIKRQSIKQGLVTYLGIIIGALSTLFVYPSLGKEKFGDIQFVITVAAFFVPFIGLGLPSVAIHFFPIFKENKEKRGRFLFVLFGVTFLSLALFLGLFMVNQNLLSYFSPENAHLVSTYLPYILAIIFCTTFITLLHSYISNFNRIFVPSIIYNLSLKIFQPALVLIYLGGYIAFTQILDGLVLVYFAIVFFTIYYLHHLGFFEINTQKIKTEKHLKKQIMDYAFFSISITVSATLALFVDKLLISFMIGTAELAVFTVPVFITEAIDVVRKAISGVSAPIVSESLKKNDIENVNMIYKKSALLQFIMGTFLLIGAWVSADDLYSIMPRGSEFSDGKIIIFILGLARLVDMLTGINTEIISFSNYYRANLYMLIGLAVVNLISSYFLILYYGITGAALATFVSMLFFNVAKLIFIHKKLKIHPFSKSMVGAVLIAIFTLIIALLIPTFHFDSVSNKVSSMIMIVLKGIIITICYFSLLWKFNISEDINQIINNSFKKIF